ncbi:hypothetical protein [Polluticaenibacter yanchengensis]|uniref:Uncharacterized protein n=1 Tax=Polluticaenibacter yanchengensis TaxID=3014562 RepID=A0ABT4UIS1_9BACT|nr:hypothetical protein [Chitinophagaceae bacterium LY-5]
MEKTIFNTCVEVKSQQECDEWKRIADDFGFYSENDFEYTPGSHFGLSDVNFEIGIFKSCPEEYVSKQEYLNLMEEFAQRPRPFSIEIKRWADLILDSNGGEVYCGVIMLYNSTSDKIIERMNSVRLPNK